MTLAIGPRPKLPNTQQKIIALDDRKPLLQPFNYANAAGVDWCVLTNGAVQIYKIHAPVEAEENLFLTVLLDEPAAGIDARWTEWQVDRQVEAALEALRQEQA